MAKVHIFNCTRHQIDHITLNNSPVGSNIGMAGTDDDYAPVYVKTVERIPGESIFGAEFFDSNRLDIIWGGGIDEDTYEGNPTFDHGDMHDHALFIFEKSIVLMNLHSNLATSFEAETP